MVRPGAPSKRLPTWKCRCGWPAKPVEPLDRRVTKGYALISAAGYGTVAAPFSIETRDIEVRLYAEAVIEGRITKDGKPLAALLH